MTILDKIVETKRLELIGARRVKSLEQMRESAQQAQPARDFYQAVTNSGPNDIQLIAEVKKASPSAGLIVPDFDPVAIAKTYHLRGATAISVLTDETYFQGRLEYIDQIKRAVPLPVLRKDFTIDEYQVYEARANGADAILLIAEVIEAETIVKYVELACGLGMTSIVEVHSQENLLSVLKVLGKSTDHRYILGINNRDLSVQKTFLQTTTQLAKHIPSDTPFISESGIGSREDVLSVQRAGARAILVGESILREQNIGAKIDELLGK